MSHRIYLVLLIALLIGTPVFAQNDGEMTIDLEETSDDELSQALEASTDIELVKKNEEQLADEQVVAEEATAETEEPVLAEEPAAETEEPVLAEEPAAETEAPVLAEETADDEEQQAIRNNEYFQESQRYLTLAESAYAIGDYDSSTHFSEEATRYAQLSDEYVALQLKILDVNKALDTAKTRIDSAASSGLSEKYPSAYQDAQTWYDKGVSAKTDEDWDSALAAANKAVETLAYVDGSPLPAQYTIRDWATSKDCLWNIAGYPWVYGDPHQWRLLYNANKSKLPDPNNPNWIEPGIVLDIPSLKGEAREGAWSEGTTYRPIN